MTSLVARVAALSFSFSVFSSVLRRTTRVARADEHLFLDLVHLGGQIVVVPRADDAALGTDDRVEQDDRAKAAADAVEKRQTEDLDAAATAGPFKHRW